MLTRLTDLAVALRDSQVVLTETAGKVRDKEVVKLLYRLSRERVGMEQALQDVIGTPPESLPETALWLAELQAVWRQLRAAVHAPDAYLVLNEIERSEAIILTQYKMLIPKIAEDPLHQVLIDQFELVRSGYGAVRELRQLRSPS